MGCNFKSERDLEEQCKIFESVFYKSTDGILLIEDGKFIECNDAAVRMLKYKNKDELLHKHPSELSPEFQPDGRSSFEKADENTKIVLENGSHAFEWIHKKSDGGEIWIEVMLTDISAQDNTNLLVVWRDIDDKKKKEFELEDLTEHLEDIVTVRTEELEQSSEIISKNVIYSESDLKGNILKVSDAFCNITGYSRDELLGQPHSIVRHPDMPSSMYKDLWGTIKSGKEWTGKIKNLKKDGGYYWVSVNITPEYDNKGNIKGYMSVRHDITLKMELKELNETLEERIKEEVEQNRQKEAELFEMRKTAQMGEMIENIAHQWRQPLTAISSIAGAISIDCMVEEELEHRKILKDMEHIAEITQHLSKTINIFSSFIKEDKVLSECILQDNINDALYILSATLKENNIKLMNSIDYSKPVTISMIKGELYHVLVYILTNSKEALVEKKIEDAWIRIELEEFDNGVSISIEDNAGGIPEDILGKVFDPYFTTKHQSEGTGLGLYISQQLVMKGLKGKLYVKNTKNGAKFFIELPYQSRG